jgi:hypothetical protein
MRTYRELDGRAEERNALVGVQGRLDVGANGRLLAVHGLKEGVGPLNTSCLRDQGVLYGQSSSSDGDGEKRIKDGP